MLSFSLLELILSLPSSLQLTLTWILSRNALQVNIGKLLDSARHELSCH